MPMIDSPQLARLPRGERLAQPLRVRVGALGEATGGAADVPQLVRASAPAGRPSASACVGLSSASYSLSVIVRPVTRTGRIRPGPQTNSTVGTCEAGTRALRYRLPNRRSTARQLADTEADTDPSRPHPRAVGTGLQHLQRREARVDAGSFAMPSATTLPSAIMSLASIASVNENDSPGCRGRQADCAFWLGPRARGWAGVQAWVIVSGLNWKTMTFGSGTRNVGMNSTKAPRQVLAAHPMRLRTSRRCAPRWHPGR